MQSFQELLGYKLDEEVMLYLLSVIEYIAADILKVCWQHLYFCPFKVDVQLFFGCNCFSFQWTGNYVKNIRKCDPTIGLQNLKIALSADTVSFIVIHLYSAHYY